MLLPRRVKRRSGVDPVDKRPWRDLGPAMPVFATNIMAATLTVFVDQRTDAASASSGPRRVFLKSILI
jgi:hypothetical protein